MEQKAEEQSWRHFPSLAPVIAVSCPSFLQLDQKVISAQSLEDKSRGFGARTSSKPRDTKRIETEVFEASFATLIVTGAKGGGRGGWQRNRREGKEAKSITIRSVFDRVIVSPSLTIANREEKKKEIGERGREQVIPCFMRERIFAASIERQRTEQEEQRE